MKDAKTALISANSGCGDLQFPKNSQIKLPSQFADLNDGYSVDSGTLEFETREQAGSPAWREARKSRLTASNFGRVVSRKATPSPSFLKSIFNQVNVNAAPLEYGKRNELKAKTKYLSMHNSVHLHVHLHKCGLVVNSEFSFLGASPDGKLCDNGKCGIVEIKCPYSARNYTITETCNLLTDFYVEKSADGSFSLKKDHMYYTQVQGQLLITEAELCEFIVYTHHDLCVERIYPNVNYMTNMLTRLSLFFRDYAKPYLNERNHQNLIILYILTEIFCLS